MEGSSRLNPKQGYLQSASLFLHPFFFLFLFCFFCASPRTLCCPQRERPIHCALFLALNRMLIGCLHLFAIQNEILFVLPDDTLPQVACIYPAMSRNNRCIALASLHSFIHISGLPLKVADQQVETTSSSPSSFLPSSLIYVPKWS